MATGFGLASKLGLEATWREGSDREPLGPALSLTPSRSDILEATLYPATDSVPGDDKLSSANVT